MKTFATPINPSEKFNDLYKRMSSVDFLLGAFSGDNLSDLIFDFLFFYGDISFWIYEYNFW